MPASRRIQNKKRSALRSFASAIFFGGLITILFCAAILQGLIAVRGFWKIPEAGLLRLHQALEEEGWRAEYSDLGYRPIGSILVQNLRLYRVTDQEAIATAGSGRVYFDLSRLLRGEVRIRKIRLHDADIFCPAIASPTGLTERVFGGVHLTAAQRREGWQIERFSGRLHHLTFTAQGEVPVVAGPRREPLDWHAAGLAALSRLVRERPHLERIKQPHVELTLRPTSAGLLAAVIQAAAESAEGPYGLELRRPRLGGEWTFDGTDWKAGDVWAAAASIRSSDFGTKLEGLRGTLFWDNPVPGLPALLPNRAELFISRLETPLVDLDEIQTEAQLLTSSSGTVEFFSLFSDGSLSGRAEGDWERGDARAEVRMLATPNPVLQNPLLARLGFRRDVFFHRPPEVTAEARATGWQIDYARARLLAGRAEVDGVSLDRAWVMASVERNRFLVSEMVLGYGDFEATGQYDFNLQDKSYRLFFEGSCLPLHISTWFGDWWPRFWGEFSFPDGPLRGDVDIRGTLGQPQLTQVLGSVAADHFEMRGVAFPSVRGKLQIDGPFIDAFDFRIARPDGVATGEFQIMNNRKEGQLDWVDFRFDSKLDPIALLPALGPEIGRFLVPFRFTSPPQLRMSGRAYGPHRPQRHQVKISGAATGPLLYEDLAMEYLSLEIGVDGSDWQLNNLRAGVAGGDAGGHIRKWEGGDEDKLEVDLSMRDLRLEEAVTIAQSWQDSDGTGATSPPVARGLLDLDLTVTGNHGDALSFVGNGRARVREADLAQVHLLGLLSRILSGTPLAFTSMYFTEAETTFTVEREQVDFPDLRLSGPASALRASGAYRMDRQEMDFSVKLFLLKDSRIPLVSTLLAPILDPLAHVTEVRLSGPVADPQWRFVLGPRNLLQNIVSGSADGSDR